MIQVQKFVNELMTSNCYIVWDDESCRCIVIDPGSKKSQREIGFINTQRFTLDYIILTHEHTDHNWGVNALLEVFPETKVVCHKICAERMEEESSKYFRLYYEDVTYSYKVMRVDVTFEEGLFKVEWTGRNVLFEYIPGHSMGSVCIIIEDMMFTGDSIMPFKPYINKRDGSKELYQKSIVYMHDKYAGKNMTVYPGHGDTYKFS